MILTGAVSIVSVVDARVAHARLFVNLVVDAPMILAVAVSVALVTTHV
jgi:hypothetical protein